MQNNSMTSEDFQPAQKKQLIEFYKAIKMASHLMGKSGHGQKIAGQLADQIILELKKDEPDQDKVQMLVEKIKSLAP
jgi:hypothetical protein